MIKDVYPYDKDHSKDKFKYRGKEYGIGTVWTENGKDYYEFIQIQPSGKYFFMCWTPNVGGVNIYPPYIDKYDLTIVDPKEHPEIFKPMKKVSSYVDTTVGWIWYIIAMSVALIFNDFLYGWIGITIIFFLWKKSKENGGK